jgi:transporter family protein
MHPDTTWIPFLAAAVLFYGLAQALTKQFMANLSVAAFIMLFLAVKLVINWGAFFTLGHAPLVTPMAAGFIALALGGNLINGFAWLFYYKALECGKVSLVGSITAGYPALTVILALMFLGEHMRWHQYLGIVMVIVSGVLLAMQAADPGDSASSSDRRWLLYSGLVFAGWGIFSAIIKAAFNAPGADTYTFFVWNAIGALLVLGPYALISNRGASWGSPRDLALGLVPTGLFALGDLALFRAFETGVASVVAPMSTIYPLVTLLYAIPVLKERMAPPQWGGVALLVAGIVTVSIV